MLTKGDNVPYVDRPLVMDDGIVLGKIIGIKRGERYIDLERRTWKIRNGCAAKLSSLQAMVFARSKKAKQWSYLESLVFSIYKRIQGVLTA